MLAYSRLCCTRSAVAFFNAKHFQAKYKILMSCETVYEALSSSLMPRDRLLRHAKTGRGAGRVLILDTKQKVKGVYLPLYCLPHPCTIDGGDNLLGVTVEDYLKVIEPIVRRADNPAAAAEANVLPTVFVVVAHPQGLAFGTFYADGRPAIPLVNTDLYSQKSPSIGRGGRGELLGLTHITEMFRSPSALLPTMERFQSLLTEHADAIARCSTFYWITRDETESLSLKTMRAYEQRTKGEEMIEEGVAAASPVTGPKVRYALSFADRRWVTLSDTVFDVPKGRKLYRRNATTLQRTIDPGGLQSILTSGTLLLDYVPGSVEEAAADAPPPPQGNSSK